MGYDSDHPLSEGEVGKCGVAISSLADMEVLFDKIPLASVTTSMTINSPAAVIWAMYLAVAEKQRSEEHTSELQSRLHLVCRLLLEQKTMSTYTHGYAVVYNTVLDKRNVQHVG